MHPASELFPDPRKASDEEVRIVLAHAIVALEECGIPTHGEGRTLVIDSLEEGGEIRHDVGRSIEVFDFDLVTTVEQIVAFVTEAVGFSAPDSTTARSNGSLRVVFRAQAS